jgi:hypothetical protein
MNQFSLFTKLKLFLHVINYFILVKFYFTCYIYIIIIEGL